MKKTLALAAVLMVVALPALAGVIIQPQGLMKFTKLASTDSTEVAIAIHAVGSAPSASQDTTSWVEITGFEFPSAVAASVAFIDFQINHQSIATADSFSYQVQFTSDEATVAGTASKFHSGAMTGVAIPTLSGATASIVSGLTSSTVGGRWVRLVLWNHKVTNSNVTRKFSVMPIVRIQR